MKRHPVLRRGAGVAAATAAATVVALLVGVGFVRAADPAPALAPAAAGSVPDHQPITSGPMPEAPLVVPAGVDWRADAAIWAAVVDQRAAAAQRAAATRRAAQDTSAPRSGSGPDQALPPTSSQPTTTDVWVVGDSIAEGIGLAWPGTPVTLAQPGARTSTFVPQVVSALAAATTPRLLVVAGGTNDDPDDSGEFRDQVQRLLAATSGCVVWTTVHRPGGRWEVLNSVLGELAASSGGRLQLAAWDQLAVAEPALLQSDGIHPRSGTVYSQIVGLVNAAAQHCPS
ncbi:MAG TPA: hypothetical protein VFN19_03500 [Candidatus Nanopelagicales bacterium]|nr:hypothetical protein [Candidatus Nanopelagicales bacterium]